MRVAEAVGTERSRGVTGVAGEARRARVLALDVFRGVAVAGMILVTDPGSYAAVYPQLLHADWQGATAADMIFPAFLFAVGAAVPIALRSRLARGETRRRVLLRAIRRTLLLVALGLVLNAYPTLALGTLRIPGVLQRIGLCYLMSAGVYLAIEHLPGRRRWVVLGVLWAALLLSYGAVLLYVPVPGYGAGYLDTLRSLPAYVDRAVFTTRHLWPFGTTPGVGVTFDPEGLLSTFPALASVLLGVLAGDVVLFSRQERSGLQQGRLALSAVLLGTLLFGAALLLDPLMPIIKKLWTPSFALLSSGVALAGFAALYWLIDVRGLRRGLSPALSFGSNAIVAFTVSGLLTATLDALHAGGMSWHAWGYRHLFLPWLSPVHASLVYAIAVVLVNLAIVDLLRRRGLFLKL